MVFPETSPFRPLKGKRFEGSTFLWPNANYKFPLFIYNPGVLESLTRQLSDSTSLTSDQVESAVAHLIDKTVAAEVKADFLTALARKGETVDEIAAFARALREKCTPLPLHPETRALEILDVCG